MTLYRDCERCKGGGMVAISMAAPGVVLGGQRTCPACNGDRHVPLDPAELRETIVRALDELHVYAVGEYGSTDEADAVLAAIGADHPPAG